MTTHPSRHLDTATVRALAAAAGVDPRSIQRTFAGLPVRGLAGKRARVALVEAGFIPATDGDALARVALAAGRAV